jgi:hypothetical protein
VSGALVQEKEIMKNGKKITQQFLVYYMSEALAGSNRYYSEMDKICYAVVMRVLMFLMHLRKRT